MNLIELTTKIDSEEKARAYLERVRWPFGVRCPRCGHKHVSRLESYGKFECAKCEYQFSVTSVSMDTNLCDLSERVVLRPVS